MAKYVQKFPGKISVAGLDSSEPVTAPQFNGALNGNATNATNAETATAVPATLVPNNADLNDYRGENYWGKRFYAGGNNSVQNLPYSYSAGFSLEVLKSGSNSTIQRLSAMTSEGNNIPTIYTRSVTDVVTGDGTWSEWQEVAEANGTYPKMKVGEAQKLSMRANVSDAGQLGWYKVGTVTVERLKAIQNANASYSLFMLVNGANPSGTVTSAARSGIIEIDTVVISGGQLQSKNGYTAIKVLCGNIDVNDFAVVIDSAGTTLTVYMDARENGVGTRTAFSVISEVYGAMSGSAFEFGWAFYGATAPADAVYAQVRNNASRAEATLIPNGIDINTYRGNDYWGKTYYAGGSNTVQNIPVSGAGFILEVLRSGSASTVQRITTMAAGSNNQPTVYTRSVVDSTTAADGAWTAWQEVAEANGTYPNMSVGSATNATNIIPDENGAVNPLGRKADSVVGANSTAFGKNSTASGISSTALGASATTSGISSTALGIGATVSGNSSTALGASATVSGNLSTALGASAIVLGNSSTALGYSAQVSSTESNTMQLGNSSLSALRCQVNLTVTSDKRDKTDISNITSALEFINKLNPVTFVSNDRVNYISESDKESENYRKYGMCEYDRIAHAAGTKKGERRRCGLLAQEVVEAMQSVYGTDNYANVVNDNFHDLTDKPSDVENKYTLAYANLVPFLIGAIKELNAKIKALESKLITSSGVTGAQANKEEAI